CVGNQTKKIHLGWVAQLKCGYYLGKILTATQKKKGGGRGRGKVNVRTRQSTQSLSESEVSDCDDDDEWRERANILDEDINSVKALTTYIEGNTATCLGVLFRAIFKKLSSSEITEIINETKALEDQTSEWLQHFLVAEKDMAKRRSENVETRPIQIETERTEVTPPPITPSVDFKDLIEQTVTRKTNERVRETFEEIERKTNLIISGMDENINDDRLVKEMLNSIGCGYLVREIKRMPVRLGSTHSRKK
ncbi:unnamed protein product, partial [Meganyctiphanes norvegica]